MRQTPASATDRVDPRPLRSPRPVETAEPGGAKALSFDDLNRVYEGFNDAYLDDPARFEFLNVKQVCDNHNGLRLELDSSEARGYWELFRANRDLLVCIIDGRYLGSYQQAVLPRQDLITLRFMLSSGLEISFDDAAKVQIPQASVSVMHTRKDHGFNICIDKNSHLCSVTVHLKPRFLRRHFDLARDRLPPRLADVIYGDNQADNFCSFPLSPGIMHTVLDLIHMPYSGVRRRLFTEAKVAELICRFFQETEDNHRAQHQEANPRLSLESKLFAAQKILIESYATPPTVAELARRVGLNRSTLCASFKRHFGSSVFEFVQDYRMNKARELLHDGKLAISQVAETVGYQHPTNFTAAFKKHFGHLPKVLRTPS
ncbi:helix-turn-helix domain-containing protein [Parahaliea mediterranea]|uniref:Helix-turn-helix transcriptional regulator n=1 Tax=Parahaliea mediterranea TaxID=651086 RepID=A0A939DDJ7_9GAMM|nr:helix-turn-helix transcriptional regulator [Parahaliea mediterranea]